MAAAEIDQTFSVPDGYSYLRLQEGALYLDLLISPKSSKSSLLGVRGDRLKVAVTEPPVDGKANEAVVRLFAELLGHPKRKMAIVRGVHAREKTLLIQDVELERVLTLLDAQLTSA